MNVVVVEDDSRVSDFLERGLRAEGFRVSVARNGRDGLALIRETFLQASRDGTSAVVLLDLMLPDMSGLDVCQSLRANGVSIPVLMLTALGSLEDRVAGLRLGADDYLVKPFAFEELLARIEALLRRPPAMAQQIERTLTVADLVLDREQWRVSRAGRQLALTAKELSLLELFMSAPGRIFSRERILATVWGVNEDPMTNIVDVYVRRLRGKIDDGFGRPLVHTVRGLGYRMEDRAF